MNPDERWTKAWTYLLLGCWLFSAFCWGGPSFPGIWNNDCVVAEKQEGAVGSELCAQVELSRNGNDVEDNQVNCEAAGPCVYTGTKIGEMLRIVEDRDLLTMMLVFMMNTLVFCTAVGLRSSGHRCQRTTEEEEEEEGFDVDQFDRHPSLVTDAADDEEEVDTSLRGKVMTRLNSLHTSMRRQDDDGLLLEEGGATPGGGASSAYVGADQLARTSTSAAFEREQGGAKTTKKKQKKKKNQEDTDLDVEKISLEMLGLFKIVRLPDEVVYVHSGADTYLYMRYQKMMIYLLWAMFLFSLLVLLPLQYSNRLDSSSQEKEFLNTFYLWANAANLPGHDDEGGGRMYAQLFATYFFSALVHVWLVEFRKLMVKLTDPTFAQELSTKTRDVERWGEGDDSNKAALQDAVSQEARARTLIIQNVPPQLSRSMIQTTIDQAIPGQVHAVHVPARCGRSLLSRTGLEYFQPKGVGSSTAFLTFKQRAQARAFRDTFKRMHKKNKNKQSLQLNLGAAGTFGLDVGVELPEFVQDTIDRVTDVDAHLEMVLNQVGRNVERAEDATDFVTDAVVHNPVGDAVRGVLCCCRSRGGADSAAASPQPTDRAADLSPGRPRLSSSPSRLSSDPDESPPRPHAQQRRNAVSVPAELAIDLARTGSSPETLARLAAEMSDMSQFSDVPLLNFPEEFKSKAWKVNWAPEAGDVVWGNLHVGNRERKFRKTMSYCLLLTVFISIAYLYNKYAMQTTMERILTDITKKATGIEEGQMVDNWMNGKSYQFGKLVYGLITIYAPVVVLCMVNYGILPIFCQVTAMLEGRRKNSSIQKAILRRNYVLMIFNILILPTLALKTPDQFTAQYKGMMDAMNMLKSYDWTIGYCHNGCLCYGASSFHVCDDASFSAFEKTMMDDSNPPISTFHPCQRRPCQEGDVPGDQSKSTTRDYLAESWWYNKTVGPGGDPTRIPGNTQTWGCYNESDGQVNNIRASWVAAHGDTPINGCSRNSSQAFGEPGGPDYHHLWPVCQESPIYCHHVNVQCSSGLCKTEDYLKIIGNFVLSANASFLYCFVVSASLLGTGWQLLNLAFYVFSMVNTACKKRGESGENAMEFWDIATNQEKVQQTMKENGYAFELGYYYAVGLVIFAIVIFYSVHFPPVCFAGLLYFNCKHFVDKYNLLYVYPVGHSDHVRSGGQMGGTVHDMVLFSLCLMQLGMAAFFKVKDPESASWAIYLFAVSLAWFFVSVRRPSPANSEIIFGDENVEIVDGGASVRSQGSKDSRRPEVTTRQLAQAYQQPVNRAAVAMFQ